MKVLKTSENLSPVQVYNLTMASTTSKLSDAVEQVVEFSAYALYEDVNAKGEENEILSFITPEGEVFATISKTFKDEFFKMVEFFEGEGVSVTAFKVLGGTSKAGRPFITCTYAG